MPETFTCTGCKKALIPSVSYKDKSKKSYGKWFVSCEDCENSYRIVKVNGSIKAPLDEKGEVDMQKVGKIRQELKETAVDIQELEKVEKAKATKSEEAPKSIPSQPIVQSSADVTKMILGFQKIINKLTDRITELEKEKSNNVLTSPTVQKKRKLELPGFDSEDEISESLDSPSKK